MGLNFGRLSRMTNIMVPHGGGGEIFLKPLYLGVIYFYFKNPGGKSPPGGTDNNLGGTTPKQELIFLILPNSNFF